MAAALPGFRWPLLWVPHHLNPDESRLIAGALARRHDPVFWHSVGGGTAGPLDYFSAVAGRLGRWLRESRGRTRHPADRGFRPLGLRRRSNCGGDRRHHRAERGAAGGRVLCAHDQSRLPALFNRGHAGAARSTSKPAAARRPAHPEAQIPRDRGSAIFSSVTSRIFRRRIRPCSRTRSARATSPSRRPGWRTKPSRHAGHGCKPATRWWRSLTAHAFTCATTGWRRRNALYLCRPARSVAAMECSRPIRTTACPRRMQR